MNPQHDRFETTIISQSQATLLVDSSVYDKEVVLKACHWFTDIAYIGIVDISKGQLAIKVELKQNTPTLENPQQISIQKVCGDLNNSILDFALRRQIDTETASIRQLILAKAFAEAGILEDEPPGNISDPVDLKKNSGVVQIANSNR